MADVVKQMFTHLLVSGKVENNVDLTSVMLYALDNMRIVCCHHILH